VLLYISNVNIRDSILAVLAYHDIFKYPLTKEEIKKYIQVKIDRESALERELSTLKKNNLIENTNGLYFLAGRQNYPKLLRERNKYSKEKYAKARTYLAIIRHVPSVRLVAITGALAMNNSTRHDDIDFFVITAPGMLWTTRFFVNLVLYPFKRSPKSKHQNNKACLNIFIDETDLQIKEQNIYTAHEIAQMGPMFEKGNTYQKFIKSNKWIFDYLPNFKAERASKINHSTTNFPNKTSAGAARNLLEFFLKNVQYRYMKSKITTEKLSDTQLFFHAGSTQKNILAKYDSLTKTLH